MRSNIKTILLILAASAVGGAALAQQGGGGGGGMMTPEMQAAREAMTKACAADTTTYCDGKQGRDLMMCLHDNSAKLSDPCKDAMSKMPARPQRPAN